MLDFIAILILVVISTTMLAVICTTIYSSIGGYGVLFLIGLMATSALVGWARCRLIPDIETWL